MAEEDKINCEIFQKQEAVMKELTDKINTAKNISEKASFAEEMRKEAEVLLSCGDYDSKTFDCANCDFISNVRKKTADMIIKTNKLA